MRFFDQASADPDGLALDDLVRRRTWSELVDRSHRLANLMRDELGLVPGDHVASVMGNRVEWFELSLATLMAGVWLVPVNVHLKPGEVAYILDDAAVSLVLADPAHRSLVGPLAPAPVLTLDDELDRRVAAASDRPPSLDGPPGGRMHYTSGTTGRPKGVKRLLPSTAGAYLDLLSHLGRSVGLDGSGPHLLTGPHYHAAVGGYALFDLCNGAPVVAMPRFDPGHLLELVKEREIAHTHVVPTMMVRLLRLPEERRRRFDPTPLRRVLHGAAPTAEATKRAMIEWWGPVLVEYWGASEAGTFTLCTSAEWLARPGSVGRPLPGVEVVAATDEGTPLPPGEVGTLWCRLAGSPQPFRYHGDDAKTSSVVRPDGWFTLGDVGRVDDDGYVALLDRADHTIISGGVNVYPAEVEGVLAGHPAVLDVAVIGAPDEEWGERVTAVVQVVPGADPGPALADELIAHARTHLASYKCPRTVEFADHLPRMPSGKLRRHDLRDLRDRPAPESGGGLGT